MFESIEGDFTLQGLQERAQKLCEQGRFIEKRWCQLELQQQALREQAKKLGEIASSLGLLAHQSQTRAADDGTDLRQCAEAISSISQRLNMSQETTRPSNVRQFSGYLQEHKNSAPDDSNDQQSAAQISTRVLCRQARYIVVYLERAIQSRDAGCLPRLADDLKRISSVMTSVKLKAICDQFVHATSNENWTAIQILHQTLDEELCILDQLSTVGLAKAS
jgi:hypothetical protein